MFSFDDIAGTAGNLWDSMTDVVSSGGAAGPMMPLGDLAFGDDERSLMGDLGGGNTATGLCDPAWNEVSGVIPTVNSKEAFGAQLAYVQSLDPGSQEYQEALGGLEAMGENDEAAHDTWGSWK